MRNILKTKTGPSYLCKAKQHALADVVAAIRSDECFPFWIARNTYSNST